MLRAAPAPLLIVAAAFSVQSGAALATTVFEEAGPLGAVWLRSAFAALVLLALAPGALHRLRGGPMRWVLALGFTLAAMNSLFYESIARVPLGVAVTVEFIGPLAVAVAGSRRARDFLWIVLAGAGIAILGSPTVDVDRVGLLLALAAGAFWAAYIVLGKRMVGTWRLSDGLALSMLVAAIVMTPLGIASAGENLLSPWLLAAGFGVAVFASVIPYVLELAALRRIAPSTFGILMSLEPAVAAVVGAILLTQALGIAELVAVAFVIVASIGANKNAQEPPRHD